MRLYEPKPFQSDAGQGRKLAGIYPFATLITPDGNGMPFVSHLAVVAEPGHQDSYQGHLAAANPHAQALPTRHSLLIFHGEHSYISPDWYHDTRQVPTWHYRVAHAEIKAEILYGQAILNHLDILSNHFEGEHGWSLQRLEPSRLENMKNGIVAFRFHIVSWQVKEKLSQNRNMADRQAVIRHLRDGDAAQQELACAMQAALPVST